MQYSIRIEFHLSEEKKERKTDSRIEFPLSIRSWRMEIIGKSGCQMVAPSRAHAQARGRRSVRVNALVQGDRKLSPLPPFSFFFLLSRLNLSLSPSLSFRLLLSRTRTDGGLSRNDPCVPMCRNNRPLREKTRVVGTIVSRRRRRRWRWPRQSQSFGEKAAGYLIASCHTPPPWSVY